MNTETHDSVLAAERSRLTAMVTGDVAALEELLADDLIYTHGSGRYDRKKSYLSNIAEGKVRYLDAAIQEVEVLGNGRTAWLHGRLTMMIQREGVIRRPDLRILSVWRCKSDGRWELAASTGTPIKP